MNYYNDNDPDAAAWLRGLIDEKLIPTGVVDERSITDVAPNDLSGFTQCHFFAGIGGWSLALTLAAWPESKPVWTGSCPCQPFSVAGKGLGRKDARHLWPAFRRLINRCAPPVVFGEQVASADGRKWLARVFADLETMGFAPAGADLCAAGIAAPHIRQRLFWVGERLADAQGDRWCEQRPYSGGCGERSGEKGLEQRSRSSGVSLTDGLAYSSNNGGAQQRHESGQRREKGPEHTAERERPRGVADSNSKELNRLQRNRNSSGSAGPANGGGLGDSGGDGCGQGRGGESAPWNDESSGDGFWSDSRVILCRDGKHRRIPVEPALFPLADGIPYKLARRGSVRPALLKGAGNAIVPETAAEFIRAYLEAKLSRHDAP